MTTMHVETDRRMREAQELLGAMPQRIGFAKGLFLGQFVADWVMPYPRLSERDERPLQHTLDQVRRFVDDELNPVAIDRDADIPQPIIDRLGQLGLLGMTAPTTYGGHGLSQQAYVRVMEILGGTCASTAVFVNAHHSIGMRALLLFGTDAQKRRWLGPLVRGEQLAAFALTETHAGSDAANVQSAATPSPDGSHFILNGEKRYITNGAIAHVLTVMARTPVPDRPGESAITALLVTPDMPGFEIVEARMPKLGIRGTVTSRLAFHNVPVPRANVLGPLGKGLRVALTVLDFGRTTFGASCTGASKTCLHLATQHARRRVQFGRSLSEFELVQKKIARMAATTYAMEAMTRVTASLIDRGLDDYMLETAMLKVFSTEALWTTVNDAFQIHGGAAYFNNLPLERMLRDARINQIGEGANDVLRSFVALVGMRLPGEELRDAWEAMHHPLTELGKVLRFGIAQAKTSVRRPHVPVSHPALMPHAARLAWLISRFHHAVQAALIRHGEAILDRQLHQERIADAAIELYAVACVLSRLDTELPRSTESVASHNSAADLFLRTAARRIEASLTELRHNDDDATLAAAAHGLSE